MSPRTTPKRSLRWPLRRLALTISLVLVGPFGCVTSHSIDGAVGPVTQRTDSETRSPMTSLSPSGADSALPAQLLASLKALELAYARGNCREVNERTLEVRHLTPQKSSNDIPMSTLVAMSTCAAEWSQSDTEQLSRALLYVDAALLTLVPTWDRTRLLEAKASLLTRLGRTSEAMDVRNEIAQQTEALARKRVENSFAMAKLEPDYAKLSAFDQQVLLEVFNLGAKDDTLFQALDRIDELEKGGAQENPGMSAALRRSRESIVLRLDELYAAESRTLIDLLRLGRRHEADGAAEALRRKFPNASFSVRTSAILKSFDPSGSSLPMPGAVPQEPELNLEDLRPEERFALARQALDEGRPDQAVNLLRAAPPESLDQSAALLLAEAEDIHVRDLRLRVRELFMSSERSTDPIEKRTRLEQAMEVLEFILKEYPDTKVRRQIERNIRSIEVQLKPQRKAP